MKTSFQNGSLEENVYMKQPEWFSSNEGENFFCEFNKSIYGLKHASCQWYLKFYEVITSFGFEENIMDQYIYHKWGHICFLVLYVDDVLLTANDIGMLYELKEILSRNFDIQDMR